MKLSSGKMEIRAEKSSGSLSILTDIVAVRDGKAGVVFTRDLQTSPEYLHLQRVTIELAYNNRLHLVGTCGPLRIDMHVESIDMEGFSMGAKVTNISSDSVRLWRTVLVDGELDGCLNTFSLFEYSGPLGSGMRSLSARDSIYGELRALYSRIGVKWNLPPDPVYDEENWHVSRDFGGIVNSGEKGLFAGFYKPGRAFGDVCVRAEDTCPRFLVSALMDGIRLDPGETRECEEVLLMYGDGGHALSLWAERSVEVTGARLSKPLTGWCSWYSTYGNISETDVQQALQEFSRFDFPVDVIQIDDGFQRIIGDWRVNERFPSGFGSLVRRIQEEGFIPGIWLAPTAVHETSPVFKKHPDWIQRLPDGSPAISFGNWGQNTYFLDPTLPEAREYMAGIIREFTEEHGFKYLKIDFTSALATGAVYHDPKMTRFEMLRSLFQLFREVAGENVYINACLGEVVRGVAGFVDASRIGPDVTPAWDETLANALKCAVFRSNLNGRWWVNDPDVVYLRRDNSRLTLEEKRFALIVAGLTGGLLLTSDLPSGWDGALEPAFCSMIPPTLRKVTVGGIRSPDLPGKIIVNGDGFRIIAVLQWDEEVEHYIDLGELGYSEPVSVFELWTEKYMGIHRGIFKCLQQPRRTSRVYFITPARFGLQVVGCSINLLNQMRVEYLDDNRVSVLFEGGDREGTLFIRSSGKIKVSEKDASIEAFRDVYKVTLRCEKGESVAVLQGSS